MFNNMPVVTRSCGRKAPRRRIEDPTPRTCKTTVKRRKEVSDEEIEKPPKKKPSIDGKTDAAPKTNCIKKKEGIKRSRIPRKCVTEKESVKTKRQIVNNDDDDEIQFKTTAGVEKAESPQATNTQCEEQQTPFMSPVAARTRSYSALRKSYRKKKNQLAKKPGVMETSSVFPSTERNVVENSGGDSLQEKEKEDAAPHQVKEIDSSTCDGENDEEKNDQYYKNNFHKVVQKLKQMQEQFSQAHQNTHKNITAYDAFIKELKTSLEQEKSKNTSIEEELKETREQLTLMTQKEIEMAKTNEKQDNNKSINTTCTSQEVSQSQLSDLEEMEKAETPTLIAMIKFYTRLTGITLSTDVPPSNSEFIESFRCAYRPKGPTGHVMQFRLTHDKEFEEYEYSPSFHTPKRGEFLHKIPAHLKENIYFGTDQAQSFLSSLIKAVQKV